MNEIVRETDLREQINHLREQNEALSYFNENGGVPFDHWGKGCPNDCINGHHQLYKELKIAKTTMTQIKKAIEEMTRIESCPPYEIEGILVYDAPSEDGCFLLRRDVLALFES